VEETSEPLWVARLGEEAEAREADLVRVRFAFFSASSFALISACGTWTSRRMKFVNKPELPVISLAGTNNPLCLHDEQRSKVNQAP
jgi:hypothetical protein